jgi:hypothetical protein
MSLRKLGVATVVGLAAIPGAVTGVAVSGAHDGSDSIDALSPANINNGVLDAPLADQVRQDLRSHGLGVMSEEAVDGLLTVSSAGESWTPITRPDGTLAGYVNHAWVSVGDPAQSYQNCLAASGDERLCSDQRSLIPASPYVSVLGNDGLRALEVFRHPGDERHIAGYLTVLGYYDADALHADAVEGLVRCLTGAMTTAECLELQDSLHGG